MEYDAGTDVNAAARLAKESDVAIVFVNQPTSEMKDLPNLSLPERPGRTGHRRRRG